MRTFHHKRVQEQGLLLKATHIRSLRGCQILRDVGTRCCNVPRAAVLGREVCATRLGPLCQDLFPRVHLRLRARRMDRLTIVASAEILVVDDVISPTRSLFETFVGNLILLLRLTRILVEDVLLADCVFDDVPPSVPSRSFVFSGIDVIEHVSVVDPRGQQVVECRRAPRDTRRLHGGCAHAIFHCPSILTRPTARLLPSIGKCLQDRMEAVPVLVLESSAEQIQMVIPRRFAVMVHKVAVRQNVEVFHLVIGHLPPNRKTLRTERSVVRSRPVVLVVRQVADEVVVQSRIWKGHVADSRDRRRCHWLHLGLIRHNVVRMFPKNLDIYGAVQVTDGALLLLIAHSPLDLLIPMNLQHRIKGTLSHGDEPFAIVNNWRLAKVGMHLVTSALIRLQIACPRLSHAAWSCFWKTCRP
mmetsp:Transcript_57654/g.153602  ORF Transcript_57654/g.153602 Transcript_57654/m.153602 type:complete len:414 (+) Transcript_57654:311-1552(+)